MPEPISRTTLQSRSASPRSRTSTGFRPPRPSHGVSSHCGMNSSRRPSVSAVAEPLHLLDPAQPGLADRSPGFPAGDGPHGEAGQPGEQLAGHAQAGPHVGHEPGRSRPGRLVRPDLRLGLPLASRKSSGDSSRPIRPWGTTCVPSRDRGRRLCCGLPGSAWRSPCRTSLPDGDPRSILRQVGRVKQYCLQICLFGSVRPRRQAIRVHDGHPAPDGEPVGVDHDVGPPGPGRGRGQQAAKPWSRASRPSAWVRASSAPVLEEPPGFPEHPGPGDAEGPTHPAVGQVEDRFQVDLDGGQHQGQGHPGRDAQAEVLLPGLVQGRGLVAAGVDGAEAPGGVQRPPVNWLPTPAIRSPGLARRTLATR